jgi:DNA-directed RNA polymerase beta' subunit
MKVPAVLIEEEFNEGQSLARQSAENTRTNWTNADKATTAQRLTKYYDGSSEERPLKTSVDIARMLGVVPGLISQYLAIAKGLTKSEMQQLAAGELTLTQAVNLARIKDKAIKDAAKQKVAEAKRVAEGKAGADPKAAKAARKEASALIDKALEDAKGEDRAKRSEGGETFPGVKPKAATKKHLKSSRTNEEIIDDFVTEFGAKAHGELADEIARAFLRYISHGKIADFGEEVESMEEEMKLKLKAAAKKQAASE